VEAVDFEQSFGFVHGAFQGWVARAVAAAVWGSAMAPGVMYRHGYDLASGPGQLSQAFGLDRGFDGADLVTGSHGIVIASDGVPPPADPVVGPRIGITRAVDFPWRWHIRDHRHVSIRPRSPASSVKRRR